MVLSYFGTFKRLVVISWSYLWAIWCLLLGIALYYLRDPLKLVEKFTTVTIFMGSLTPKFYVALTGTSSLISGIILMFEWWYFKRNGASFIEQISLSHLGPWLGSGGEGMYEVVSGGLIHGSGSGGAGAIPECKVWRNPLNLFRGAEYQRFQKATQKEPLTYYDMNLSAQDHQTFFSCDADVGKAEYELMQTAWRERTTETRVKYAKEAIALSSECATGYILLAEEEAVDIVEAEAKLREAYRIAEINHRRTQQMQHQNATLESQHRRDTNVMIYIRRRLAMCARKLGRIKEAVKMFKDLTKEVPPIMSVLNVHENLLEALLEAGNYADVQAVLSKYDDISLPKSAAICYTAALLKTRAISEKFSAEMAGKRSLSTAELSAVDAIHRAVEFNPHVPKYLLEAKPLILPSEHILKRGDSEAIAYSFFHLQHWKRVDGALGFLFYTWEGTFRLLPRPLEKGHLFYPYPSCTECADRELLPAFHRISVYPRKELPFFILFTAGLCSFTALLALLTHAYPDIMGSIVKTLVLCLATPIRYLSEKVDISLPSSFLHALSRI